ncbi:MAG: DUF433 domain-containing protein [Deltaproteobacteria bacterium]|nr:DUF433 domain-containing protein [Deltaproteobacteria bacterium]
MSVAVKKTGHPYISTEPKISGRQYVISGTRIKVMDIAIQYELMGKNVDMIIDEYPHLRLEQVHDALSYYYEHKGMFDKQYRLDQVLINQLKKNYPSKIKAKIG